MPAEAPRSYQKGKSSSCSWTTLLSPASAMPSPTHQARSHATSPTYRHCLLTISLFRSLLTTSLLTSPQPRQLTSAPHRRRYSTPLPLPHPLPPCSVRHVDRGRHAAHQGPLRAPLGAQGARLVGPVGGGGGGGGRRRRRRRWRRRRRAVRRWWTRRHVLRAAAGPPPPTPPPPLRSCQRASARAAASCTDVQFPSTSHVCFSVGGLSLALQSQPSSSVSA